jgi:signal peptidase I
MDAAKRPRVRSTLFACAPALPVCVALIIWVLPFAPGLTPFIAGWWVLCIGIGMVGLRTWWHSTLPAILLAPIPLALTIMVNFAPVKVNGHSMQPTLQPDDVLLVDETVTRFEPLGLYVIESDRGEALVKRLVGMPGQTLEARNGRLYADGVEVHPRLPGTNPEDVNTERPVHARLNLFRGLTLADDRYYFIGDNPEASRDSRQFGSVDAEAIQGRVVWRLRSTTGFGPLKE